MSSRGERTFSPVGGFVRGLDSYVEVGPSQGAPTDQEITESLSSLDVTSEVWELSDIPTSEPVGPSPDTSESTGPSSDTTEAMNGSSEPVKQTETSAGETTEPLQEPREEFQDPEEFFDAIEDSSDEAYEDEYLDVIGGCRIA